MYLIWLTVIFLGGSCSGLMTSNCEFNSMCSCSTNKHEYGPRTFDAISCQSVPFYNFPNFPEGSIRQLEIVGSNTAVLDSESLAKCQVQALILTSNRIQHVSERAFSSSGRSLTALDLSYNQLDEIPAASLKGLRNLQWINLHGNRISSTNEEWYHLKNTVTTLFLGENDLTEIPNEIEIDFRKLTGIRQFKSLIWLNLDGNKIHKIHRHSLPISLQTASFSHNLIDNISMDIIADLPNLKWLYLRGNHIRSLAENLLPQKLWLEEIDLGENYLKALPKAPRNSSIHIGDFNLAFNDFHTLRANRFSGYSTRRIILSHNLLENIDVDAFDGIQTTLEYLDLSHNNLQYIPQAVAELQNLRYLYLSSNALKEVPEGGFENVSTSLKAISLSTNYFLSIPTNALQNCTKIFYFNIGSNEIYEISEHDFSGWTQSLRSLILNNNRITNLQGKVFSNLQELRELSLNFNPLRMVEENVFFGLTNLENLELSFTLDGEEINPNIFEPLTNLKWLSLDHNALNKLPDTFLDSLTELRYLNTEFNNIKKIPNTLFKSTLHDKMEVIQFSNNEISRIEANTFRSLRNVKTILLSYNRIEHISADSFVELNNLKELTLSDNVLTRIESGAFSNLPSLSRLDLQRNSLTNISWSYFVNVTGPLLFNASRNQIYSCVSNSVILRISIFDLRYNNLAQVPECLKYTASLEKLYLEYNIISSLENNDFVYLTSLEYLSLQQNNIGTVSQQAFAGLEDLQVLNLSKNFISILHAGQFSNMPKLRILDLSENSLNHLPRDIFINTSLEMLELSSNLLSVVPSSSISDVNKSLRFLSISFNVIEHIDITTFPDIPQLHHLDLSYNKISILPDNVFMTLALLQSLHLDGNPLRANFKELFHYARSLRALSLAGSNLTLTPYFPLPNLAVLNLSRNCLETIDKYSVQELGRLKVLDLSRNYFYYIPANVWMHLPKLTELDLSHNPIKVLNSDSFVGLQNLKKLNIQKLNYLSEFDSKSILQLRVLSELWMQTWPNIEHFSNQFCYLLTHLNQLRMLKIHFLENELIDQLLCLTNRKIRYLEITGRNLKTIREDALVGLTRNSELYLKIEGTQIEELPSAIFSNMHRISYLTIDLRHNYLAYLSPDIFHGNSSSRRNAGTTLIKGGLYLSENPFRCGCHITWLRHWLRRWSREGKQTHTVSLESTAKMHEMVRESTCIDISSGMRIPIVDLPQDDSSCHASALSAVSKLAAFSGTCVLTLAIMFVNFNVGSFVWSDAGF